MDFGHTDLFVRELDNAVRTHPDFPDYDWQRFARKTVYFLFVYSMSSAILASDNDARDTKALMDCITKFTLGVDSEFCCSVHETALRTDEIPEGTYVTVVPNEDTGPEKGQVLTEWKTH